MGNYISNFEFFLNLVLVVFLTVGYLGLGLLAMIRVDDWMLDRRWRSALPDNALASCLAWVVWPVWATLQLWRVNFTEPPRGRLRRRWSK